MIQSLKIRKAIICIVFLFAAVLAVCGAVKFDAWADGGVERNADVSDTVEWTKNTYVPMSANGAGLPTLSADVSMVSYQKSDGTKGYYLRIADFQIPYNYYSDYNSFAGWVSFENDYFVEIPFFRRKIGNGGSLLGFFNNDDRIFLCEYKPSSDLKLVSVSMSKKSHTVTFDSAGGSVVENQTIYGGVNVTIPTPFRIGYDFMGWYYPNGVQYTNQPIMKDMTFTAQWEKAGYSVLKRPIYSENNEISSGVLSGHEYINNYQGQFEHFEYVVGLPTDVYTGNTGDAQLSFTSLVSGGGTAADEYYLISFSCKESTDGSALHLEFGQEMASDYRQFDYKTLGGSAEDGLYVTITDEYAYVSYFPAAAAETVSEKGEYRDSLSNVIFAYKSDSPEYEVFYKVLLGSNCSVAVICGGEVTRSNSVNQSITLYNTEALGAEEQEGYTFTGWYYDEECTQKYDGGYVSSDTQLYAGYEINKYTVTYYGGLVNDPNEAGLYDRVDTVEHGGIADYIPPAVEGMSFLGWRFEDGTAYENTPITQNTTLYGQWESTQFTVTLDFDGGTSESGNICTVERGEYFYPATVTREGYTFVEWRYIDENGLLGERYTGANVHSDLKLKAIWERIYFTVDFYVDGEIYGQKKVPYGIGLFDLGFPAVIKEGHTLIGWYLGEHCENETCTEYNFPPIYANVTLHGHFEINKYTVTYFVNGEVFEMKTVEHGAPISDVVDFANNMGLRVMFYRAVDGQTLSSDIVSCDMNVEAEEMNYFDKTLNVIKQNKWKVIGGVAGGVAIIVIISTVCGGTKRKRRHKH